MRLGGIVVEEVGPDDERDVGHSHRRAGMSRLRFFDGVDSEETDGVDAELFETILRADFRLVALLGTRNGRSRAGVIGHGKDLLTKRIENFGPTLSGGRRNAAGIILVAFPLKFRGEGGRQKCRSTTALRSRVRPYGAFRSSSTPS